MGGGGKIPVESGQGRGSWKRLLCPQAGPGPRASNLKGRTQLTGSHSHLVLEMPQGPREPLCHTLDLPKFWGITGRLGTAGDARDRSPLLAGGMDASVKDELRENQKNPLLPHT